MVDDTGLQKIQYGRFIRFCELGRCGKRDMDRYWDVGAYDSSAICSDLTIPSRTTFASVVLFTINSLQMQGTSRAYVLSYTNSHPLCRICCKKSQRLLNTRNWCNDRFRVCNSPEMAGWQNQLQEDIHLQTPAKRNLPTHCYQEIQSASSTYRGYSDGCTLSSGTHS